MVRRVSRSTQFREAALPTLERVRRDRERVSERAAPLLAFIEEWLFDVDLDLRLGKQLEALPEDVVREFCEGLGVRPHEYVRERRLDVAERLLRITRWAVWQVAAEIGFRNTKQLQYGFKTRTGRSPSEVRPEPSEASADETRKSGREPKHSVPLEVQGMIGALEPQGMVALVQRLRSLVPSLKRREPSRPRFELSMPGYKHERELAETVWTTTHALPTRNLRHLLCRRLRFQSPALFRLLGEKGREIGRRDRKRGVALVGLGVEVLEANADAFGESVHDLLTVGWSWTANQRRLQLDWPGSEEAFGFAREEWETPRESRDPVAEAEYCNSLASFRFFQGRLDEARQLTERALELLRSLGDKDLLVRVLSLRIEIAQANAHPREWIFYLREALEIVDENENPYLAATLSTQITMAYILAGEIASASAALLHARALLGPDFPKPCAYQILWLEGLIRKGQGQFRLAEQYFQESRAGLAELGEMTYFAVVTLTLAELYVQESNTISALELISEIIPILETFAVHRSVLAAIRLLRIADRDSTISVELLAEVKKCLTPIQGRILAYDPPE